MATGRSVRPPLRAELATASWEGQQQPRWVGDAGLAVSTAEAPDHTQLLPFCLVVLGPMYIGIFRA